MPLGTLDRTPPPFFRQGFSARSKLVFFAALAVFLMVADTRFKVIEPTRAALATALLPVQRVLAVPVAIWHGGSDYLRGLQHALSTEREAQARMATLAERAARADRLALENERLRALLDLRPAIAVRSLPAEVMYEAADPYSRKVFIDRGTQHGVVPGAPVINEAGVLGQVTRAFALNAEVTLLVDKDAAIPVLNVRTQQRSAAFGGGAGPAGGMELRFVSASTDVQEGDLLQTSGVDGVYPSGLPVARVVTVQRRAESGFARVTLEPAANPDGVRHVLVLEPLTAQLPPPPPPAPTAEATRAERQLSTPRRETGKP
ncbi:MAG TPA: rod shape-determining protein MreC [Rubrivivax sp.]|nr:rod shape-determining protein MreC [Rubrivivax sp.]